MVVKRLAVCLAVLAIGFFAYGYGYYAGVSRPLGDIEKRNIVIDYACGPEQNWRMMKLFCGSIPKDERKSK